VRENLKNVLLFMAGSRFLVSPKQDPSKEKLWTETWKRIDRFLPDLRSDLALEEPEPEKKTELEPAKSETIATEPTKVEAATEEATKEVEPEEAIEETRVAKVSEE
jgi:golgi-specific brefeldin A-resistance guanine nucleotide exchange factor 1